MRVRRKDAKQATSRRLVTTLGELITAAYDAAPGMGTRRAERAVALLTRTRLIRHMTPHVEFVR